MDIYNISFAISHQTSPVSAQCMVLQKGNAAQVR